MSQAGPTQAEAPERRRLKITRRQDETVTGAPSVPEQTQPGVALALAQSRAQGTPSLSGISPPLSSSRVSPPPPPRPQGATCEADASRQQRQAWLVATLAYLCSAAGEGLSASAQGVAGQLRPAEGDNQGWLEVLAGGWVGGVLGVKFCKAFTCD